jgi:hypothetical protein
LDFVSVSKKNAPNHSSSNSVSSQIDRIPITGAPERLFIAETERARIFLWQDVHSLEALGVYYQQRLGPQFRELPVLELSQAAYTALVHGPSPLLVNFLEMESQAAKELFVARAVGLPQKILIGFWLESVDLGARVLDWLSVSVDLGSESSIIVRELRLVIERTRRLVLEWQRDRVRLSPFGYHRISIPAELFERRTQTRDELGLRGA